MRNYCWPSRIRPSAIELGAVLGWLLTFSLLLGKDGSSNSFQPLFCFCTVKNVHMHGGPRLGGGMTASEAPRVTMLWVQHPFSGPE